MTRTSTHAIAAVAIIAVALTPVLTGCAANETPTTSPSQAGSASSSSAALSGTLSASGATSVQAAQQAWVAAYQTANPGVTVNYSPVGSGAGRSAFSAGAVGFAGSDRAFQTSELGAGKFAGCTATSDALDLPIYISPIAVVVNIKGVTSLTLDPATLAGIFAQKITYWDDPAIKATNAGVTLPHAAITAVHRADDSGTTSNFTDTMSALAPSVWTWGNVSTWPSDLKGEAATGTSGVIAAVSGGDDMIGYADESQAKSLTKVSLLVNGTAVAPSAAGAIAMVDASQQESGRAANDLALSLNRKAAGVYPAALVSYVIVCQDYKDQATAQLVKSYIGYIASNDGQQTASSAAGSAPLPASLQAKVLAAVASIQ